MAEQEKVMRAKSKGSQSRDYEGAGQGEGALEGYGGEAGDWHVCQSLGSAVGLGTGGVWG